MTIRTNSVQTCDRCLKPFNEKHLKTGETVPAFKQRGLIVNEIRGTNKDPDSKNVVLFSFDDMCPDCQKAVDNLLVKLRMDGATKKKKRSPAKKRGAKATEESKPPVTEYAEGEGQTDPESATPGEPDPDAPPPKEETEAAPAPEEAKADEADVEKAEAAPEATSPKTEPDEKAKVENSDAPDADAEGNEVEAASDGVPEEASDGGNGAEASSKEDDGTMTDPSTGDVYDAATGEVVSKGSNGESGKHPF